MDMFEAQKIEKASEKPLEECTRRGLQAALNLIRNQFEHSFRKENNLAFHNTEHTESVVRRTGSILRTIRMAAPDAVSEKDIALGKLAAAFHDVIQGWQENQVGEKTLRKRDSGTNEKASTDEAIAFLNQMNEEFGEIIFSEEDFLVITESINGTVPGFSVEKKTVIQPNITERASLIARALALADIGTAGMDGTAAFFREGNELFREENLDIAHALEHPEAVDKGTRELYKKRMLDWSRSQIDFASGRRDLLDTELDGMPQEAIGPVKNLFSEFNESIKNALQCAEARKKMTFNELVLDMGFLQKQSQESLESARARQERSDEEKAAGLMEMLG